MSGQMEEEHSFITYPTWKKYMILSSYIEGLRVKEKRHIFHIMRRHGEGLNHDSFFPQYGFTTGEFAVWQVLTEHRKSRNRRREPVT